MQITVHRPELAEKLHARIKFLPGNKRCVFAPFGGIIINMGDCSEAHTDELDDQDNFVVLPFTKNCVGGALVLHEAPVVMDFTWETWFPSCRPGSHIIICISKASGHRWCSTRTIHLGSGRAAMAGMGSSVYKWKGEARSSKCRGISFFGVILVKFS